MTDKPFNRRDFLKIAGVGAAAFAVSPKLVNELDAQNPEKEGEFGRFGRIETENAYYYPFFERHDNTPDLVQTMERWETKPKAHFYELLLTESAADINNVDPLRLLFMTLVSDTSSNAKDYGRRISDKTLDFYSENNIPVAFEGINLPDKFIKFHEYAVKSEVLLAWGIGLGAVSKIQSNSGESDPKKKMSNLLLGLGASLNAVWSMSPNATSFVASNLELLPESKQLNTVKDAIWNVDRLIRDLHPEQMVVFFRNLVMARKLQTLAKYYALKEEEKPGISFLAGFAHEGIKDLLILGESVTIAGFNLYPREILKEIVDANGGIDAFCSTMVVGVHESFSGGGDVKKLVLDSELKDYLETRLE